MPACRQVLSNGLASSLSSADDVSDAAAAAAVTAVMTAADPGPACQSETAAALSESKSDRSMGFGLSFLRLWGDVLLLCVYPYGSKCNVARAAFSVFFFVADI